MSSWTLEANDQKTLLVRAKMLPEVMEGIQRGYGFFIRTDITLMLVYWLLHWYHAYFTFQASLDNKCFFLFSRLTCYNAYSYVFGTPNVS